MLKTSRGYLHYRRHGEGEPVVLLQTIPFDNAIFEALMQALGPFFTCYAIDMMGYGQSDRREGCWMVADYSQSLEDALDRLGLECVRIVSGHTTAMIATDFAVRRSERVRALVLDGVAARTPAQLAAVQSGEVPRATLDECGDRILAHWRTVFAVMKRLNPELVLDSGNEAAVAHAFFAHMEILLGPDARLVALMHDLSADLARLALPTLLIGSPTDTMRGFHENALALIPGVRGHLFEGINPLYQFDRPERAKEYAAVLLDFFASCGGTAGGPNG